MIWKFGQRRISCTTQLFTRFQRCVAAMPSTASLKAWWRLCEDLVKTRKTEQGKKTMVKIHPKLYVPIGGAFNEFNCQLHLLVGVDSRNDCMINGYVVRIGNSATILFWNAKLREFDSASRFTRLRSHPSNHWNKNANRNLFSHVFLLG